MGKLSRPRFGSLQFWPRKRAVKQIPSVNWSTIKSSSPLTGFITYKVGMATAVVKDMTDKSMTANKKIFIPVTILEAPNMKIFSVRFYNKGKVAKDIVVSADSDLKTKLNVPKSAKELKAPEQFDDVRVIAYSIAKQTNFKKTPDVIELDIGADSPDKKLEIVKGLIGKEFSVQEFLKDKLLDIRSLTKGHGFSGPVKRFGITLKGHKSEKGVRRPGSLAPWHPARVTFRTPMAGQLGMFSRVQYNSQVITSGSIKEKDINPKHGFRQFGKINSNYIILKGSVHGPQKRQVLVTPSFRPTKEQAKKKYEFVELLI